MCLLNVDKAKSFGKTACSELSARRDNLLHFIFLRIRICPCNISGNTQCKLMQYNLVASNLILNILPEAVPWTPAP